MFDNDQPNGFQNVQTPQGDRTGLADPNESLDGWMDGWMDGWKWKLRWIEMISHG